MKEHITRRRVLVTIALLLLLLWWLWPDGKLARVQALQREMADAGQLTPEERRAKGQELRAAMDKLSPQQRSQLRNDGQKRMEERMAKYFAMSAKEKQEYLDQQIQQMQQMTQQGPPNGGGPGGGAGGPPGGGPGGGPPQTAEEKERRRQQRLDNTSPEFRAQMDQFRKDMAQRSQQLGLPATPPRGG
jgi:exonuclease VII large subunit